MPIFEYQCLDCGAAFEKFVRHPGQEQVLCASCGRDHVEQQISSFGFPVPGKFRPRPVQVPTARDYEPHDH